MHPRAGTSLVGLVHRVLLLVNCLALWCHLLSDVVRITELEVCSPSSALCSQEKRGGGAPRTKNAARMGTIASTIAGMLRMRMLRENARCIFVWSSAPSSRTENGEPVYSAISVLRARCQRPQQQESKGEWGNARVVVRELVRDVLREEGHVHRRGRGIPDAVRTAWVSARRADERDRPHLHATELSGQEHDRRRDRQVCDHRQIHEIQLGKRSNAP